MNGKPVFTVPAKTIINFDSGFKAKLLCDGPTFTAGTACQYSCSFCYVPSQMKKQKPWLEAHGVTGEHKDIVIRRANAVEIARKQLLAHPEAERMQRKVIYGSPLTDVAANMELVRETVELCKVILELTNWDIRLLSKSNLLPKVACELSDFVTRRIIYGVSTGTYDDKLAAAIEQGTPLVSKRIESLSWLQDNGFRTFGMICPSLPLTPGDDEHYEAWAHDMFHVIRGERCEHVWAEVINLRGESFDRTHHELDCHGFTKEADALHDVMTNREKWEAYARATYQAHAKFHPPEKLRFLQYTTKATDAWWKEQKGAVIL